MCGERCRDCRLTGHRHVPLRLHHDRVPPPLPHCPLKSVHGVVGLDAPPRLPNRVVPRLKKQQWQQQKAKMVKKPQKIAPPSCRYRHRHHRQHGTAPELKKHSKDISLSSLAASASEPRVAPRLPKHKRSTIQQSNLRQHPSSPSPSTSTSTSTLMLQASKTTQNLTPKKRTTLITSPVTNDCSPTKQREKIRQHNTRQHKTRDDCQGTVTHLTRQHKTRDCDGTVTHLGETRVPRQQADRQLVRVARVAGDRLGVEGAPTRPVHVEAPLRAGHVDDSPVQSHHLCQCNVVFRCCCFLGRKRRARDDGEHVAAGAGVQKLSFQVVSQWWNRRAAKFLHGRMGGTRGSERLHLPNRRKHVVRAMRIRHASRTDHQWHKKQHYRRERTRGRGSDAARKAKLICEIEKNRGLRNVNPNPKSTFPTPPHS